MISYFQFTAEIHRLYKKKIYFLLFIQTYQPYTQNPRCIHTYIATFQPELILHSMSNTFSLYPYMHRIHYYSFAKKK